jgi:hypothetical protein
MQFGFLQILHLKTKGTTFMIAVCWLLIYECWPDRSFFDIVICIEFEKAIANKADFRSSYNYTIDPARTKPQKHSFLSLVWGLQQNMILSSSRLY